MPSQIFTGKTAMEIPDSLAEITNLLANKTVNGSLRWKKVAGGFRCKLGNYHTFLAESTHDEPVYLVIPVPGGYLKFPMFPQLYKLVESYTQ